MSSLATFSLYRNIVSIIRIKCSNEIIYFVVYMVGRVVCSFPSLLQLYLTYIYRCIDDNKEVYCIAQ